MPRSKRYQAATKKIDRTKKYPLTEAVKLVKSTNTTKFDASIEVHIKTGINTGKTEQMVRGSISLPHGTGKTKIIAAFVSEAKEKEATEAGANIVGGESLIAEIKKTDKVNFEIAITTPDMMPKLAGIAKILGPKGLMPTPKNETITQNLKKTIAELKGGKINFKNDDTGNIHQVIGKVSFSEQQLAENFTALVEALKKARPSAAKGVFIRTATLSSSMGPGIKVQL